MTWMEKLETQMKAPAIGTSEWFVWIPEAQIELARHLVASRTPVVVQRQSDSTRPSFLIVFDGTEFVAGGFDEEPAAESFARAWNGGDIASSGLV